MPKDTSVSERLEKYREPDLNSGCWLWAGLMGNDGYGRISVRSIARMAHRIAYIERFGPIPEGMLVCHKCDVPVCVNPDHLFVGTHQDNMADKSAKGRAAGGSPNGKRNLSAEQKQILLKMSAEGLPKKLIARTLNMSVSGVRYQIAKRKNNDAG